MAEPTIVPFGSPDAENRLSDDLFTDTAKKSFFASRFTSESEDFFIQRLPHPERDTELSISPDLSMRRPFSGRQRKRRTAQDIREIARDDLSDYWARYFDEMNFIYLSGARGINEDFIEDVAYVGHPANLVQAPDAHHIIYAGAATSKESLTANDKMTKNLIVRVATKAKMIRAVNPALANLQPVMIDGSPYLVLLMSPSMMRDLRTSDPAEWTDIQGAAKGYGNPIFIGAKGMIDNIILHEHRSAIRFNDYGAGGDVAAGRALLLGARAGVMAFGSSNGLRFIWGEEKHDYGNEWTVNTTVRMGTKKTRFSNTDLGVIAIDCASD